MVRGAARRYAPPPAAGRGGFSHPFTVLPVEECPYGFARPEVRDVAVDALGELYTPRDVLARSVVVERLPVGDVLVFGNAGGYGWDISHRDFLRHPYPEVVWI